MTQATTNIIDALVRAGRITDADAANAQSIAGTVDPTQVLQVLVQQKQVTQSDVIRTGAEMAGKEFVDLSKVQPSADALALISGANARRLGVFPLRVQEDALVVAGTLRTSGDMIVHDDLVRLSRMKIEFVIAMKSDIQAKINQVYRAEEEFSDIVDDISDSDPNADAQAESDIDDAPIVRLVNLILGQAVADRASDIHLEPTEHDLRVRYRIDGVLHETTRQPRHTQAGVISRIKIMSSMDISERRVPQDGRLSFQHQGKRIDMRVNTLPTVWGEKVVLRVLDNANTLLDLSELGFGDTNMRRFKAAYRKPYGMILVTGPTGSGKSTTLYATLNQLAKPEVNVITVEDPVEYRIAGINQIQVNKKAGLTFDTALRSIVRADPDIILVGEIRDQETAKIAIEAALTGHLVLTTLHTNDAPSAITRLIEMGIEPFLVSSALDVVVAQRLCRVLCVHCKEAYEPTNEELAEVGFPLAAGQARPTLYKPVGCLACSDTGFLGRMALQEVMPVSDEIERLGVARATTDQIKQAARAEGMEPLRADGWAKVLAGHTSVDEVLRIVA